MIPCQICSEKKASYKCPVCRLPFCTVNCFQVHKQSKCEQVRNVTENDPKNEDSSYSYVTEDTLPIDKLKFLENNADLQNLLSNKHLRDILIGIDGCKDPNLMLERVMKEPIFVEFVDACLQVVGESKEVCI